MKLKTKKSTASAGVHVGGGAPKRKKGVVLSANRIAAVVFLLAFGAIGAHYLFQSHADSYKVLYKMAYPNGGANDVYQTTNANSASLEQSHGWKLLGQYKYVNEPGSTPVAVYLGHKTGTRNNVYVLSPANIPSGYVNKGVVFYVSSSAKVPYGYCRSKASGYKLDTPCATNPAPVTKPIITPVTTPAPTSSTTTPPKGTAPAPVSTGKSGAVPLKANHNPYGYIDYCAYTGGKTVVYGWATDPDAPQGADPKVSISVHKLAHDPNLKGTDPSVTLAPNVVPTDGVQYRDNAINAYIKKYHQGDPVTGTYGFRAAYTGLTKDGFYTLSGTAINVGALGSSDALNVNETRHADGDAGKPFFAGHLIPASCLAPVTKQATPVPPAPVTAPVATPVASPKPIAHGVITVTGKVDCTDKNYVATANKCVKIQYKDIAHGKKATNANKIVCDDGYVQRGDKCKLDNTIVVAYSGNNDGCGGDATHYAHNKKTHVAQKNYGKDSFCQCVTNNKFVGYTKPISDSKNNPKCVSHASSTGSQGSTRSGGASGSCNDGSWYTAGNGGGKTYYRCVGGQWATKTCESGLVAVASTSNDGPCGVSASNRSIQTPDFCRANGLTYDASSHKCGGSINTNTCTNGTSNLVCKKPTVTSGSVSNNHKKHKSTSSTHCVGAVCAQ